MLNIIIVIRFNGTSHAAFILGPLLFKIYINDLPFCVKLTLENKLII